MLIATDLDGTLLTLDGAISPRTRDAIRGAEKAGVPVVPVTARQIYGIETVSYTHLTLPTTPYV